MEVLAAVDFFTVEVWTASGLMTFYVLSCMRVASRQICIAGITTSPNQSWMEQMARNISCAETGFLNGCRYLLHDRDAKFCHQGKGNVILFSEAGGPDRRINWPTPKTQAAGRLVEILLPTSRMRVLTLRD
jgi:hypothetical protein